MDVDITTEQNSRKKRRHPDSSTAPPIESSLELLQRIEHPNFEELARWNPVFAREWLATQQRQKEASKTFSACVTQEFTVALTGALLKTYLGLQLPYLDNDHLCPPVPNRFFFLHWIHTELLNSKWANDANTTSRPLGLDIGAGATAIYSLLAAKFFRWSMFTTEIDAAAATMAKQNVRANFLSSSIHVACVSPDCAQQSHFTSAVEGPLQKALNAFNEHFDGQQQSKPILDFVMTNPPFNDHNSTEECSRRQGDGRARTAMTVSEGSYPGGEVAFVIDILIDSLQNRHSSKWFASMFGKKTSAVYMYKLLVRIMGPAHVRMTEYGPGQYTRWFVAWTFQRPSATDPTSNYLTTPNSNVTRFRVSLPAETQDPGTEVACRLQKYCESSPGGWHLSLQLASKVSKKEDTIVFNICEKSVPLVSHFVDESNFDSIKDSQIPEGVAKALRAGNEDNNFFLPQEGHFLIQVFLRPCPNPIECEIQYVAYRHSSRGHAAIKKICAGLEGDICRSNRYWRRRLQREQML